jgi:branched-chain amino acid transport system substrate-binding protein
MKKKILVLLVLAVFVLALTACAAEDVEETPVATVAPVVTEAPKVTRCADGLAGETITYYSQAGLTGPLSTILGGGFVGALNDAIAEINAAGGICGATVELVLNDTQYDADQEVAIYQQVRELAPFVNEDKIVNFAAGLNAKAAYVPRNGYTVGIAPIYSDQFAGFLTFLDESWDDIKPDGAGDEIIVGVLGWDHPFGEGATTPEALAVADDLGIKVLPLEKHPLTADADVVTPLQTLALGGANVIYYQGLGPWTAMMIGTLHGMELWDKMVVGGCNWAFNADVLVILGDSAPAMIGFYGVFPWNWWNDTDVEGIARAITAFDAGGYPAADKAISYLMSYAGVFGWADIVEHAIDMFGFENLNGENFMAAFLDLGKVDNLGVFHYDVRGENRAPSQAQIRQVQLVDGEIEFVVVEDFFQLPDTRPPAE